MNGAASPAVAQVDALVIEAAALHRSGRFAEAIIVLDRAAAAEPQRAAVHFNRGLCHGALGQALAASEDFERALRCQPDWFDARLYRVAYTLEAGDVDAALAQIDEAFRISPGHALLREQQAIALERKAVRAPKEGDAAALRLSAARLESAAALLHSLVGGGTAPTDAATVRRAVELLSRARGATDLAADALAEEAGRLLRSHGNGGFPGSIVLATMPKSGSEFLWMALATGLNLKPGRISSGSQLLSVVDIERLEQVVRGGYVTHGHINCSDRNRAYFARYVDRLVVHVRDPRQALISWVHFLEHPDFAGRPILPEYVGLEGKSFAEVVDFCMEQFVGYQVGFLQSWLEAEVDPAFPVRLLFTRQEDLGADAPAFFRRILDFYDLDAALFHFPEPPRRGERHFRKGETDEWRRVLRPEQIARLQAMVPDHILHHFGWPR